MSTVFTSKFFKLIQTFDKNELKSFEDWLRSPWCNSNRNLVRLVEKVKKYHPAFDDSKLTKEKLFKKVLPAGKFSDRRMNNLFSEGYQAAERFTIFQRLSKDPTLQKKLLLKEFQGRHLDDWFFKESEKEIGELEAKPAKEWEDHLSLLALHRRIYHHEDQSRRMQPGGQTIVKMGEQIDLVYLLEKAAIIMEKIFRNRILKDESHEVTQDLEVWLKASKGIEHVAIDFYRKRFAYAEENMLDQYLELRTAFIEKYTSLNIKEQKIHLFALLNDTAFLIKKKLLKITDNLPLYKLGLKSGILFQNGKLSYATYAMIVGTSNLDKNFEFTDFFISHYTEKVDEQFQEDCKTWALAHTHYYRNDLESCLNMLQTHNFNLFHFQLIGRILNTQVYFDLYLRDETYEFYLFNYFDSFEKWLMREKVWAKGNKFSFIRFVQKCRSLAKFYADVDPQIEKLNDLFETQDSIQSLAWLKQKKREVIALKKAVL